MKNLVWLKDIILNQAGQKSQGVLLFRLNVIDETMRMIGKKATNKIFFELLGKSLAFIPHFWMREPGS